MKLLHLNMHNFLSYLDQEVDFTVLDYCVIEGANGSGKSSIFQAVCWAIYGKTRVHGDRDSVVNDKEEYTEVSLDLEDIDGQKWRITRSRNWSNSTGAVRIHSWNPDVEDWEQWGDHQNSTAEQQITEVVGISEDAFFSLVMLDTSEGSRFTNASSNQRRNILLGLLPELSVWGGIEYRAREALGEIKEELKRNDTRSASTEEEVKKLKGRKRELQEELPEHSEEELRRELEQYNKKLGRLQERANKDDGRAGIMRQLKDLKRDRLTERERAIEQLKAYDKSCDNVERLNASLRKTEDRQQQAESRALEIADSITDAKKQVKASEGSVSDLEARIERLNEEKQRLIANANQCSEELSDLRSRLEALGHNSSEKGDTNCWVCGSSLSEHQLHSIIHEVQAQISQLQGGLDENQKNAEKTNTRIDALTGEKKEHIRRLRDAQRELSESDREKGRLESSASEAKERKAEIQSELDLLLAEFALDDAKRERIEGRISELRQESEEEQNLKNELDKKSDDDLVSRMNELEEWIEETKEDIELTVRLTGGIREHEMSLDRLFEESRSLKREREALVQRRSDTEILVYSCSSKGVPSVMLDEVLQEIQDKQNEILSELPGIDQFTVKFQRKKHLKSREGQADVLDIIVRTPNGWERPVETLSSGEKVKITLSSIFAMVEFFNARNGRLIDTLMLDEPLGTLDQEVIPAVIEALIAAMNRRTVSKIMIITHDQRVIDALPQGIAVTRTDESGSKIDVMS